MSTSLSAWIPWWAKVCAKLVLSRLPVPYKSWKKIGLFVHGSMDRPQVALQTFAEHLRTGGLTAGSLEKSNVLEVGPGDSIATAIVARAYGASACWLVDSGDFASRELAKYHGIASECASATGRLLWPTHPQTFDELLFAVNATYLTDGVSSLMRVPSDTIDFLFSNAVLEHIRLSEFAGLVEEMHRILAPKGVAVHRIDLKDHLGGALNNLRFSRSFWEADWMAKSGFYTNRIRYAAMLQAFRDAGFEVQVTRVVRWSQLPTPRQAMSLEFRELVEGDLLVSGFDVVLRRRSASA
jgi:SAM-dependent methyltransferase